MRPLANLLTIGAFCASLVACGGEERDTAGTRGAQPEASVRVVAERFLQAEARGDAAAACALLSRRSREALAARSGGSVNAGCARHFEPPRGGPASVSTAEIERVFVDGDYAEVFMRQDIPDAYVDSLKLADEGGEWRVTLPELGIGPA